MNVKQDVSIQKENTEINKQIIKKNKCIISYIHNSFLLQFLRYCHRFHVYSGGKYIYRIKLTYINNRACNC